MNIQTIIGIIIGILTLLGMLFGFYRFLYRVNHKLDKVIVLQPVMMKSLFACLDGLTQLGANGKVSETKDELLKALINE